jgi:D-arabinose 1-dehydrogenase-like Zn-dependent alcohol dehydrogenase
MSIGSVLRWRGELHHHSWFVRLDPRQGHSETFAFVAEGEVQADIELQYLSSINRVFKRMERGDVASRRVLEFATG